MLSTRTKGGLVRRDSQIIFITTLILVLGIVGVTDYLYKQNQKHGLKPRSPSENPGFQPAPAKRLTPQSAARRTATPIKCSKADGSVFWTNAIRCEDADLDNRLSFSSPVKPIPRAITRKPDKRGTATRSPRARVASVGNVEPLPRQMNYACKFPIGMARKIEAKSLRLKDDPAESVWKDPYCRWVREAEREHCGDVGKYLRYTRICNRY